MSTYGHHTSMLQIDRHEVRQFDESSDSISITQNAAPGAYTIGASGDGVFVTTNDRSVVLTFKTLQHSADNKHFHELLNQQLNNIKAFSPMSFYFKDTINGDEYSGEGGYFIENPAFVRGQGHNPYTYTIHFVRGSSNIKKGLGN